MRSRLADAVIASVPVIGGAAAERAVVQLLHDYVGEFLSLLFAVDLPNLKAVSAVIARAHRLFASGTGVLLVRQAVAVAASALEALPTDIA